MESVRWGGVLVAVALLMLAGQAAAQAIVGDGELSLGIRETGVLGVVGSLGPNCTSASLGNHAPYVSLRTSSFEAMDCDMEGESWSVAWDGGFAWAQFGSDQLILHDPETHAIAGTSFAAWPTAAPTHAQAVALAGPLKVKSTYAPLAADARVYQVTVVVTNTGTTATNVTYKRIMNWAAAAPDNDIGYTSLGALPSGSTPPRELVRLTRLGYVRSPDAREASSGPPMGGPGWDGPPLQPDVHDAGPDDGGAIFQFRFPGVAPGSSRTMVFHDLVGRDRADALRLLGEAHDKAYAYMVSATYNMTRWNEGRDPYDPPGDGSPVTPAMGYTDVAMPEANATGAQESAAAPDNLPPTMDAIGRHVVELGGSLSFEVRGSDPDGDPLTYSASELPAGSWFDAANRTFHWQPSQAGLYCGLQFAVTSLVQGPHGPIVQHASTSACVLVFQRAHDADADGVQDAADDCPGVPDRTQADQDGDGAGDACDADPCHAGGDQAGPAGPARRCTADEGAAAGTSSSSADRDHNGVPDVRDVCPSTYDPGQADADHDGAGDACDVDRDGDGVADVAPQGDPHALLDDCPGVADPEQQDADGNGIGDACQGAPGTVAHSCPCPSPPRSAAPARAAPGLGGLVTLALAALAVRRAPRG